MNPRRALVLVLGLAGVAPAQEPSFHVDVRMVNITATVKDEHGALIGDLEKSDFTILAGGVEQKIAVFEHQSDRPLSVVMLFDSSPSVAKESHFEQDSARRFLRSLLGPGANPGDALAVYKFSDYVQEVQDFTHSADRLERAIYWTGPHGGTSVYDALYLAARRLSGREGRRVIVIITDGGDTTSTIKFNDALEQVQLADAIVYSVIVVPITSDAGRNLGGENALKTMSASTGGIAFLQYTVTELDAAFQQIERDLRTQYLIGFYPRGVASGSGRFRRVEVRAGRPGARVLCRTGYFVGPDQVASKGDSAIEIEQRPARARPKEPPKAPSQPQLGKPPSDIPLHP